MKVDFFSPECLIFQAEANEVHVPGDQSCFTILPNHAPVLSPLSAGTVRIVTLQDEQQWSIESGFIDIHDNQISIVGVEVKLL